MTITSTSSYTRRAFTRALQNKKIAVNAPSLSPTQQRAARAADLNDDGYVSGGSEAARLWTKAVDRHDNNGDARSIRTRTQGGRPTRAAIEAQKFLAASKTTRAASTRTAAPSTKEIVDHMKKSVAAIDAKYPNPKTRPVWAKRMRGALKLMIRDPSARRGVRAYTLTQQDVRLNVSHRAAVLRNPSAFPTKARAWALDPKQALLSSGSSLFDDYGKYLSFHRNKPTGSFLGFLKSMNNAIQSGINELNHQKQVKQVGASGPWALHDQVRQLQNDPRSVLSFYGVNDPAR